MRCHEGRHGDGDSVGEVSGLEHVCSFIFASFLGSSLTGASIITLLYSQIFETPPKW